MAMDIFEKCALFQGLTEKEKGMALELLCASQKTAGKGEMVLIAGESVFKIGILLEGGLQIIQEEYTGERSIVASIFPGEIFAEAIACTSSETGGGRMPVTVMATEKCRILWIEAARLLSPECLSSHIHARLVGNLLRVLASKNLLLNAKMRHLGKRTTREKVLSYLADQAAQHCSSCFEIPFTHQELADYLCVERSGLSAVLSGLRQEGSLAYERRKFRCLFLEK